MLLGQFKRSDVFTAELCPGMKEVQAEVRAKVEEKNTLRLFLFQSQTSEEFDSWAVAWVCVSGKTSRQLIWVSKEVGFSF